MTVSTANTYQFSCQVVEVIYNADKRIIKAICNPGSMIIETPDAGKAQLGDRLMITGSLNIDTVRIENNNENRSNH
jgi:hypothetical protein